MEAFTFGEWMMFHEGELALNVSKVQKIGRFQLIDLDNIQVEYQEDQRRLVYNRLQDFGFDPSVCEHRTRLIYDQHTEDLFTAVIEKMGKRAKDPNFTASFISDQEHPRSKALGRVIFITLDAQSIL